MIVVIKNLIKRFLYPSIAQRSNKIFDVFHKTIEDVKRVNQDAQAIITDNNVVVKRLTDQNHELTNIMNKNQAVADKISNFLSNP